MFSTVRADYRGVFPMSDKAIEACEALREKHGVVYEHQYWEHGAISSDAENKIKQATAQLRKVAGKGWRSLSDSATVMIQRTVDGKYLFAASMSFERD